LYAPKIQEDQLHELYKLAKVRKRPMTKVLRQILAEYFEAHQQELSVTVETRMCHEIRKEAV
jgi:hypothetical protein